MIISITTTRAPVRALEKSWDRAKPLVIFDELHKMKNWKSWLKGIYDTEKIPPSIIVTSGLKLDAYKKVGDSLAGKIFEFRLHPLDLKKLKPFLGSRNLEEKLDRLLQMGGFSEPYLEGETTYYNRWKSHLDIILKEDMIDLKNLRQNYFHQKPDPAFKEKVGTPISYKSLAVFSVRTKP